MTRTFIDQPTQVFNTDSYNDALTLGISLQTSSLNLESDLNALRTQVRQLIWASQTGSWYDQVQGVANLSTARGVNQLNLSLTNVENQKFLFDVQCLAMVSVPTGSNFISLSASGSTAPTGLAAVGLGSTTGSFTGTIVATLPGQPGSAHSINQVSGSSPILPRNLCVIRDYYTHETILDSANNNYEIYGLLQVESGAIDSTPFADTTPGRTQISFVVESPTGYLKASSAAIGGRVINYQYRKRVTYLNLPEDAYASTVFVDVLPNISSSGGAQLSDITLQRAIANQFATVTQGNSIAIQIAPGQSWSFLSGSTQIWSLSSNAAGNSLQENVAVWGLSSSLPAAFQQGISAATGSTTINVGVTPGTINTLTGSSLTLSAGNQLNFSDGMIGFSAFSGTLQLANSVSQWNAFAADFGSTSTIIGALNFLSQSLSGSLVRTRATAGVTTRTSAYTNITYPTNLDAQLLSYVGRDFVKNVNVYLNGILLLPGPNASTPNDVYPGTNVATGDLVFPYSLRSGTQLTMERF